MLHPIKRAARRILGPSLTRALKRLLRYPAPAEGPAPPKPEQPAALPAPPSPPPPPADPPKRLLFLSDCYAEDVVWGPFHRTMQAYLGSAFEAVLAVRTNAFFHPWSHRPYSAEHVAHLDREVRAFAPDLIFSINRAGLSDEVLAAVHPDVKAITVFVDYYDRIDDGMHHYGPRDLVWGTGTRRIRAEYLRKYSNRLRPEQAVHTVWGADHSLFYPRDLERGTGIVFVGTPFNPEGFVNLVELISHDEHNRRAFLETYEAHRDQFVYDWVGALRAGGFAFDSLPPHVRPLFEDNALLQGHVCDQVSIEMRIAFLSALAGLDVKIYGYDNRRWVQGFSMANARMVKHLQFRPVSDPAELARLYCSSKIGINIQHDHARGHGLSFRAFDLMACRALLLSHVDAQPVMEEVGFVEDRDYVCFRDPAELRRKCEYYLDHEDRRRAIAESGYRKVLSGHTLAHRFAEVFSRFGYSEQADHYERLCGPDVRTLLDAEAVVKDKVTTLRPPQGRAAA